VLHRPFRLSGRHHSHSSSDGSVPNRMILARRFCFTFLLAGCSSSAQLERDIAALQQENAQLRGACFVQQQGLVNDQRRTECLVRETDAKQTCEAEFRDETNPMTFNTMVVKCLAARGFPNGTDSCN